MARHPTPTLRDAIAAKNAAPEIKAQEAPAHDATEDAIVENAAEAAVEAEAVVEEPAAEQAEPAAIVEIEGDEELEILVTDIEIEEVPLEEPAFEPEHGFGDGVPAETVVEVVVEAAHVEDPIIPYAHPDNGSIDGFETDEHGNTLAPASAAPTLAAHGFVPATIED